MERMARAQFENQTPDQAIETLEDLIENNPERK